MIWERKSTLSLNLKKKLKVYYILLYRIWILYVYKTLSTHFVDAASSFGKILFKKPKKKSEISNELTSQNLEKELVDSKKSNEIDLIFNLNEEGIEKEQPNLESESNKDPLKKKYLEDEEQQSKIYGLQEPPVKKRFIDKPNNKVTTLSASKVLAREAKAGNKKLLSFYDEEEEEKEEYIRDDEMI